MAAALRLRNKFNLRHEILATQQRVGMVWFQSLFGWEYFRGGLKTKVKKLSLRLYTTRGRRPPGAAAGNLVMASS
jgi:hypothetical protein